jgi:hypothetical protein
MENGVEQGFDPDLALPVGWVFAIVVLLSVALRAV